MSKLKLKKVKGTIDCGDQYLENMKNNSNPTNLQKTLNTQHLFSDDCLSKSIEPSKPSIIGNPKTKDSMTSKYFETSSLPEENYLLDESEVEFKTDKKPKRKAVTPKKDFKKKSKPTRSKNQKDIRDAMNSRDNLLKYTQEFEKECASAGVDVNPEHLQLAIALSRSITDFQRGDTQNFEDVNEQNAQVELTPSQAKIFEQGRIRRIRKTLDEFGFKVQATSGSRDVKPNVKKKIKKGQTYFPLLTKSREEKSQVISDNVSQILFESVSLISHNWKCFNDTPNSAILTSVWCDSSCVFTKSCHAYKDVKNNMIYYTSDLVSPSKSEIGCLLRDWDSIPGREKSPERIINNHPSIDFRETEIYLNNFDALLSGTYSMILAQSNKKTSCDLGKINAQNTATSDLDAEVLPNSKLVQEIFLYTSRCSSPDMFGDDSYTDEVFLIDEQKVKTVEQNTAVIINDLSDDDLPRVYVTKTQKSSVTTLPNMCEAINSLNNPENFSINCDNLGDVSSDTIYKKSIDLCQDDSKNNLSDPVSSIGIRNDTETHLNHLKIGKDLTNISRNTDNEKSPKESFDLTQDDSESSLSIKNTSPNIDEEINSELDILNNDKDKMATVDIAFNVENNESMLNTSDNFDLSGIYEGKNGIIHYESFQTSPISAGSVRRSQIVIDSSSDHCDEEMFDTTQKNDVSFDSHNSSVCEMENFASIRNDSEENSPRCVDLTQSSKGSDVSLSTSYSVDTEKHVSCQSLLVANKHCSTLINVNSTICSIVLNKDLNYYEKFPKNTDKSLSPTEKYLDIPPLYSSGSNKHVNPTVVNQLHSDTSNVNKSNNEFSSESSTCNDIFVISDEEFHYSMSTPYNKKVKSQSKKTIKNSNFDNANVIVSKSGVESPDLSEDRSESPVLKTHEGSKVIRDSDSYGPTYNLNLCGSSLFDRIPSCNSSILCDVIQNNSKVDIPNVSNENIECNSPSTSNNSKSVYRMNFKKKQSLDFTDDGKNSSVSISDKRRCAVGSVTPDNSKYLVETNNVTPVQDFNEMDTPKMMKELSRFGLKPLKRKRAVQLLEHIYNETHPLLSSKIPPNKRIKCKADDFASSTPSQCKSILHNSDEENYPQLIETEISQNVSEQVNDALDKSLESQKNTDTTLEDKINIYNPDQVKITIKQIDCNPDDWIFQNKEKAKIHGCRVPLHIAFHNYLSLRSKLREAILRYEPVNIETIHRGLISEGYRYNTKDLFHFMDKKCITIKTTDKNVATKRQKKR